MNGADRLGLSAGVVAWVIYGLLPLYWRLLHGIPVVQILTHRLLQTFVVAGLLVVLDGGLGRLRGLDRRTIALHGLATVALAGHLAVFVYAILTDRLIESSLGFAMAPLAMVGLGAVVLRERLDRMVKSAVSVVVIGVVLLAVDHGSLPWISVVLAAMFGLYSLLRKLSSLPPVEGLLLETTMILPIAAAAMVWWSVTGAIELGSGFGRAALALVGVATAVPLLLHTVAVRRLPLVVMGVVPYLSPVLQFFLGYVVFNETASAMRLTAIGIIWVGLVISLVDQVRSMFTPTSKPVGAEA